MSDVINALKRLERTGNENSRTTQKLFEAAKKLADEIEGLVPVGVKLPRNYRVIRVKSNIGSSLFLVKEFDEICEDKVWVNGYGGYLQGDFNCYVPAQTRDGVLQFAEDIATFLEKRSQKNEETINIIEKAAEALRQ